MKKKRRIKVWPVITVLVVICLLIFGICIKDVYNSLKNGSAKQVKILDSIENYNYELNENDPKYVKSLFKELKSILKDKKVDEENYVSCLSQIFLADFYTLNSAINKNDVGGTQFVYQNYQEDFVKKAKASVYHYVENNIYGNREQELPIVTNVEITSIEEIEYDEEIEDSNAYKVEAFLTYKEDLEYEKNVTLILIHNGNKLEIAEMK